MQTVAGDPLTHDSVNVRRTVYVSGTASPSVSDPFVLGPMDSIVPSFIPITAVFIFPQDSGETLDGVGAGRDTTAAAATASFASASSSSPCSVIHFGQLQLALSRVLDYYPHLAGRFRTQPDGTRLISALQSGAGLVEANCSATIAELKGARPVRGAPDRLTLFQFPADGNALLAPYDFSSPQAIAANPVLTVQYTRFACGGVAIGIRQLHTICDASGFFLFARHLAEVYRAITAAETHARAVGGEMDLRGVRLEAAPSIHGYGAGDAVAKDPNAGQHPPPLYHLSEPKKADEEEKETRNAVDHAPAAPRVAGRELHFTAHALEALKKHAVACDAAQVVTGDANKDDWVSTFEALTALLWQRTYMAQYRVYEKQRGNKTDTNAAAPPPPPPACGYLTSYDVRRELQQRGVLPPHYVPNALTTPIMTLPREALLSGSLADVARPLHQLIRDSIATRGDYWVQVSRWVASLEDKTRVQGDFAGGVMTSQWNKIDMYDGVSFVDGRPPALVFTTFTPISLVDGLGYFLPDRQPAVSADGSIATDGGLTVVYALSEPVWKELENDPLIAPHMIVDSK